MRAIVLALAVWLASGTEAPRASVPDYSATECLRSVWVNSFTGVDNGRQYPLFVDYLTEWWEHRQPMSSYARNLQMRVVCLPADRMPHQRRARSGVEDAVWGDDTVFLPYSSSPPWWSRGSGDGQGSGPPKL